MNLKEVPRSLKQVMIESLILRDSRLERISPVT
jgi:hypothetical protein